MRKNNIIITLFLLALVLSISAVLADDVYMNIDVNGTATLDIMVQADDTLAREAIAAIEKDLYGNISGSGEEDVVLEGADGNGDGAMSDICNDPELQTYFEELSNLPPDEFVSYMKSLGYDDESHINMIWTMCQQQYISEKESSWTTDKEGLDAGEIADLLLESVSWLNGETHTSKYAVMIGTALDRYFATDRDVYYLVNGIRYVVSGIQEELDAIWEFLKVEEARIDRNTVELNALKDTLKENYEYYKECLKSSDEAACHDKYPLSTSWETYCYNLKENCFTIGGNCKIELKECEDFFESLTSPEVEPVEESAPTGMVGFTGAVTAFADSDMSAPGIAGLGILSIAWIFLSLRAQYVKEWKDLERIGKRIRNRYGRRK